MKRILLTTASDSIELGPGNHVIGRDLGCQLRFNDASVSRRHVRIEVAPDGIQAEQRLRQLRTAGADEPRDA